MLKTIAIRLFFLFMGINLVSGQVLDTSEKSYDFHMEKYRKNDTAAKICAISGGASILTGFILIFSEADDAFVDAITEGEGEAGSDLSSALIIGGGIAALVSIPLFIKAKEHHNNAQLLLGSSQKNISDINVYVPKNLGFTLLIPID